MTNDQYWTIPSAFALFDVQSPETVRNWAKEFEQYLSEGAKPEKGKTRRFTYDDMRVLALVDMMQRDKEGYEAIHVALKQGDRAELPVGEGGAIVPTHNKLMEIAATIEENKHLTVENQDLRSQITRLETQLEIAQSDSKDKDKLIEQIGMLKMLLKMNSIDIPDLD